MMYVEREATSTDNASTAWKFTRLPTDLDSYGLDPYAFRVLAHIWRRQQCFASLKTIAALCGMSVRQVQHALKTLESKNMVKRRSRRGKTNIYTPTEPSSWKKLDFSAEIENADAQDYFNRALLRRERKDFQGALDDLSKSLFLYEQELITAQREGKLAARKQQDIRDTKNEIVRLVEKHKNNLNIDAETNDWIEKLESDQLEKSDDNEIEERLVFPFLNEENEEIETEFKDDFPL